MNTITEWANKKVESMTEEIKSAIDCGMDLEDAVDLYFENSTLGNSYKMQVLSRVSNYRHAHNFVMDKITGKMWCATCQKFQTN